MKKLIKPNEFFYIIEEDCEIKEGHFLDLATYTIHPFSEYIINSDDLKNMSYCRKIAYSTQQDVGLPLNQSEMENLIKDKIFTYRDMEHLSSFIVNNALNCNNYTTKVNSFIVSLSKQITWNVEIQNNKVVLI